MSDRAKAKAFGAVFMAIAHRHSRTGDECSSLVKLAFDIWRCPERYDFTPDQMNCDAALCSLGLASKCQPAEALVEGPYRYADRNGELKT